MPSRTPVRIASPASPAALFAPPLPTPPIPDLADELRAVAAAHGLDAISFASADPFLDTRQILHDRKAEGLHGGMHFTYGDPDRSTDPARALRKTDPDAQARTLVVAARSYRTQAPPPPPPNHGRVARYSWQDEYEPLRRALDAVAAHLTANGYAAKVLVDDNALVDRAAAYRAGLGWYGKNANLLLPNKGSYVVLGSVVTDAPLPHNDAPHPDACGTCTRCLPACPTGALVAPGVLDARRCLAWLLEAPGDFPLEFREALGGRVYGCDDCQEACPPNRTLDRHDPAPPATAEQAPYVDLLALLAADDSELLDRFGRWYVPRRQARYLRRNALVALGNVGDPDDPAVQRAVAAAQQSEDPIVASHADWAARRLAARAARAARAAATPVATPAATEHERAR